MAGVGRAHGAPVILAKVVSIETGGDSEVECLAPERVHQGEAALAQVGFEVGGGGECRFAIDVLAMNGEVEGAHELGAPKAVTGSEPWVLRRQAQKRAERSSCR